MAGVGMSVESKSLRLSLQNDAVVLCRLRTRCLEEGSPKVAVSVRKLAPEVGLGEKATYRVLRRLKDQGAIREISRKSGEPIYKLDEWGDFFGSGGAHA
jgi:ribosomal protein S25